MMSMNRRNRIANSSLCVVMAALCFFANPSVSAGQHVSRTEDDDKAMRLFEYHLGEWGPPPEDEKSRGVSIVYEWAMKGKTVRVAEYHTIDGKKTQVNEGLIGYHYGQKQIVYQEFVLDGVRPFEVMYTGRYWFEDGNVMKREFTAYDPDTTSRTYRETVTPTDPNMRKVLIEYMDDNGQWKKWGEFTWVRRQAESDRKAERKEIPTKYFEPFIGEWEPSDSDKQKNPRFKDWVSAFEWGPQKRVVRILEGYPAGQKEKRILEGFAFWNPVTGRVEFYAYNSDADFLFKGEYTILEKGKIQREYEVYYPADHDFAKRGYNVIKFRETHTLKDPDTIDGHILYFNKKDNRWDPWGGAGGHHLMVRRNQKG
ncbi:MAG: hypothetical protein L0229_29195 [Blastocatellia bacterium]|nr:hypothetical protein [Blastocatellia bacterium]